MIRALNSLHRKGLIERRQLPRLKGDAPTLWFHPFKFAEHEAYLERKAKREQAMQRRFQRALQAGRDGGDMGKLARILGMLGSDHDHEGSSRRSSGRSGAPEARGELV